MSRRLEELCGAVRGAGSGSGWEVEREGEVALALAPGCLLLGDASRLLAPLACCCCDGGCGAHLNLGPYSTRSSDEDSRGSNRWSNSACDASPPTPR